MRSAKDLQGMTIVDVQGGTKLGHADEIVVSPDDGRLLGFVMRSGGPFSHSEQIVEASDIRAIGQDAITVEGADLAHTPEESAEEFREARSGGRKLTGAKVVTQSGTLLGTVGDYMIDESARRVAALTIGGGVFEKGDAIPAERIVSVGPDVVVVRDEGEGMQGGPFSATGHGRGDATRATEPRR